MRNAFIAAAVAVVCVVAATDPALARDVQQARSLIEQKKFDEAYALIEKAFGARNPSTDTLSVGMEAAVGSGRIVVGGRLARQLVRPYYIRRYSVYYL